MIPGIELPEAVARCVSPDAAEDLRRSVARGAIPLGPRERLSSLAVLLADPVAGIREEARGAWRSLPPSFVVGALEDPLLPTPVVDLVAALEQQRPEIVWKALEHPALGPRTVERFLESEDEEVLHRLARNHRLLGRHPDLARRLLDNPSLHPEEWSRLASLFAEAETGAPAAEDTAPEAVHLPPQVPRELLDEAVEGVEESQNLYQLVQGLSVSEKIKLATLGNKGARRLLIRDTNKLVAVAVIRSPKIRDDEVLAIAQDRTMADEVIRVVLGRKDWLKGYPIRLALAQNPKTPLPKAVRLLETLYDRDLRQVAKSRNVPSAVASGALRVLARRGKT
ncbi:MAG: hypothetical protein HZB55_12650 [Deltaproteobacteria bacterium]|nr:hypothetical protein [Deltaproteobacteria bacterium]